MPWTVDPSEGFRRSAVGADAESRPRRGLLRGGRCVRRRGTVLADRVRAGLLGSAALVTKRSISTTTINVVITQYRADRCGARGRTETAGSGAASPVERVGRGGDAVGLPAGRVI